MAPDQLWLFTINLKMEAFQPFSITQMTEILKKICGIHNFSHIHQGNRINYTHRNRSKIKPCSHFKKSKLPILIKLISQCIESRLLKLKAMSRQQNPTSNQTSQANPSQQGTNPWTQTWSKSKLDRVFPPWGTSPRWSPPAVASSLSEVLSCFIIRAL